jgi:outer membrane protein assembly factor BamB
MRIRLSGVSLCLGLLLASQWLAGEVLAGEWTTSRGDAGSRGFAEGSLPKDPQKLWEFTREKSGFEGSPVIANGRVWAGDVEGKVFCIDLANGAEVWSKSFKNGFVAAPALNSGKLILGDYDGHVYCLSSEDGSVLWEADIQQAMAAGANFYENLVLITNEGGQLFAYNLEDGQLVWQYETGDQLRSAPTVWNGFAFLGGCDGRLHKIDLKQGTAVGDGLLLDGPSGSTPAILGNTSIVPTQSGLVLAFDLLQGERNWVFSDSERSQEIRSSPAVAPLDATGSSDASIAVITTRNRRVLGLDMRDGSMLWEAVVRKRCDSSAVICDGRAWVGGLDGTLYALDLKTGEQTWTYSLTGQLLASPSIVDGKLVVATDKGSIVCFGNP